MAVALDLGSDEEGLSAADPLSRCQLVIVRSQRSMSPRHKRFTVGRAVARRGLGIGLVDETVSGVSEKKKVTITCHLSDPRQIDSFDNMMLAQNWT